MKITYRPEIDGLRAIAVSAVILYHAQITILGYQPFAGGFIGVDVFFVISGYLITSIILTELITTGSFSFKLFYERRIRRLLPVLLFVMLMSLPFAWMYLLPSSFLDFSRSILYSLGFGSNFYFHYTGQEYGAETGLSKPFLHTWSLAVEEQYYILFPVFLLIIFRYFRKYLTYILIIGFAVSLGQAEWFSRNYPSISFYFLHTRIWELLAGSILAYFEITLGGRSKIKTLNLILPTVGLFLILHSIVFLNNEILHPSHHTLSAIIGVCLIIWYSNKDELITKILASKLFIGIGLISYSLYLWHYPVFAFSKVVDFAQGNLFKKLLIGTIILILSIFSYYFIERPFRNKKNSFKLIILPIAITLFVVIFFNANNLLNDGYKDRLPKVLQNNFEIKPWNLLKENNEKCFGKIEGCKFNISSNKKIILIGDSHMAAIMFDLKNRVLSKNYQFSSFTLPGCIYFPGINFINKKTKKINEICNDKYFQNMKEILLKESDSIIIFGGRFPVYLSNDLKFDNKEGGVEGLSWRQNYLSVSAYESLQDSFKNEITKISRKNKIILIYPIPEVGWNPVKKIFMDRKNKLFLKAELKEDITTSYKVYKDRSKSSFELLDSINNENIHRVYPHKIFCKTRCITHNKENIFYSDSNHPSKSGAEMINNLIMDEIKKIELKK